MDTNVTVSAAAELAIPSALIAAAMLCMAHQDVRYYLNGVLIEVDGTNGFIVGTDGVSLFAARFDAAEGFNGLRCILPSRLLKMLPIVRRRKKWRASVEGPPITFRFIDGYIYTVGLEVNMSAAPVDGRFPDWRSIVPSAVSGESANYNPLFLSRMKAVADCLGDMHPYLQQNGKNAAGMCVFNADACYLVMPWVAREERGSKPISTPDWARKTVAQEEPAHA